MTKINAHPCIPLNSITEPYYKRRQRAWRKFCRAQTVEEKIKAREEIGEVTSDLLRLLRSGFHVQPPI